MSLGYYNLISSKGTMGLGELSNSTSTKTDLLYKLGGAAFVGLIASIAVNIAQANDNKELRTQLEQLKELEEYLKKRLEELEKKYEALIFWNIIKRKELKREISQNDWLIYFIPKYSAKKRERKLTKEQCEKVLAIIKKETLTNDECEELMKIINTEIQIEEKNKSEKTGGPRLYDPIIEQFRKRKKEQKKIY